MSFIELANLALGHFQCNNPVQAFEVLSQIESPDTPSSDLDLLWAIYFLQVGNTGLAVEMLDRVLRVDPSNITANELIKSVGLQEALSILRQHVKPASIPKIELFYDINDGCNLRCVMCSARKNAQQQRVLSKEIYKRRLIPFIQYASEFQIGCQFEPLMIPWFEESVFMLREAGISQQGKSISNGTLLSPAKARAFIECDAFKMLRFSIDGATPELYEEIRLGAKYDIFMRNIQELVKIRNELSSKTRIGFLFTLQKRNVHELPALIRLAVQTGVDSVLTHKLWPDDFGVLDKNYYGQIMASIAEASDIAKANGIEFLPSSYDNEDAGTTPLPCSISNSASREKCTWLDSCVHVRIDAAGDVFFDCQCNPEKLGNLYCSDFQSVTEGFLFQKGIERMQNANRNQCGQCGALGCA